MTENSTNLQFTPSKTPSKNMAAIKIGKKELFIRLRLDLKNINTLQKTFVTLSASRNWSKDKENIMRMSEQNEEVLTINDRFSVLSDEVEELKIELRRLKQLIKKTVRVSYGLYSNRQTKKRDYL
jgi:hypothetical protein